jgi:hypothetical protein
MAIDESVDWDADPEDLIIRMVPKDDPEYGGSIQLRLNNARKIYANTRNHDVFYQMRDADIVRKLKEADHDRFCPISNLAIMIYANNLDRD